MNHARTVPAFDCVGVVPPEMPALPRLGAMSVMAGLYRLYPGNQPLFGLGAEYHSCRERLAGRIVPTLGRALLHRRRALRGHRHAALATRAVRHPARRLLPERRLVEPAAARRRRRPAATPWRARASRGTARQAFQAAQYERARKAAARLIGADPDDVALISSVGYGVATAGKVLAVPAGRACWCCEDDHTSPVLEWMAAPRPAASRSRRCSSPPTATGPRRCSTRSSGRARAPLALASISSVHWSDGGALDLDARRAPRCGSRAPRCWSMPRTSAGVLAHRREERSIPTS